MLCEARQPIKEGLGRLAEGLIDCFGACMLGGSGCAEVQCRIAGRVAKWKADWVVQLG